MSEGSQPRPAQYVRAAGSVVRKEHGAAAIARSASSDSSTGADRDRPGHIPRWWSVLEWAVLFLSPVLGALAARAAPMAVGLQTRWTMIDPTFYTAYAQHPGDLLRRFSGVDYYWVRLGFILPAAASEALLGPVPGFVAFRYILALLAVISGYLLCRRFSTRPVAWSFVTVVVTNPIILMAWASDYPDSAALAYLVAASALLALPVRSARARLMARLAGGVLLGLAVNSHAATLPFVVGLLLPLLAVYRGRERLAATAAAVVGAVGVTLVLALTGLILWGHADIIGPSVDQYLRLRRPEQIALWHSSGWAWTQRATYLLVPVLLLVIWSVLRFRDGQRAARPEAYLLAASALGLVLAVWSQAGGGASLEYYLYSSLLWWSTGFVTAACLHRVLAGCRSTVAGWFAPAAVVVVAVGDAWLGAPVWRFDVWPTGVVLVGVAALIVFMSITLRRFAPAGPLGATAVAALVLTSAVLTIGQPVRVYVAGQAGYPLPDFSGLGQFDSGRARDVYRVVSAVPSLVPLDDRIVLSWVPGNRGFPGPPLDVVAQAAAQYPASQLGSTLPVLRPVDAARLDRAAGGTYVLLLSGSGDEFGAAEVALAPWRPHPVTQRVLTAGDVRLHADLIQLAGR